MLDFSSYDFNVSSIRNIVFVPHGTGVAKHTNRFDHGLVFNTGEKQYRFSDGNIMNVGEGEVFYLPRFSSYEVKSQSQHTTCIAINFGISEDITFSPFTIKPRNSAELCGLFQNAEHLWTQRKDLYNLKCKSILYDILAKTCAELRRSYYPQSQVLKIKPAIDYIAENYTHGKISVGELSSLCGVSRVYLARLFTEIYGESPMKYISRLKIERAKELITAGEVSIASVAELCGFEDNAYFSRDFKKIVGMSPTEFRKTAVNLQNK